MSFSDFVKECSRVNGGLGSRKGGNSGQRDVEAKQHQTRKSNQVPQRGSGKREEREVELNLDDKVLTTLTLTLTLIELGR